ncbi:MAG: DUF1837 domain-containing protein [Clostridia bacterium]|nr:DUF1837 domain-containing protein [Clostridia bacterium]
MRETISNLLSKTIVFKYQLPHDDIKKTDISTQKDKCFSVSSNKELSELIYNGIVEYAYGEKSINLEELDLCQKRAIVSRLRYEESASDDTKLKYGFYGEVVLDVLLKYYFKSSLLIAKGYFYNPLENEETKGYDSFQFYYSNNNPVLLLGEAKFHKTYKTAVDDVIKKMTKATSVSYFNKNILAIINLKDNLDSCPVELLSIIEKWENDPNINLYNEIVNNSIKLLYPVLLIYDQFDADYDKTIKATVEEIDKKINKYVVTPEMSISILFIFVPVNSSQKIKEEVLEWISQQKPLI